MKMRIDLRTMLIGALAAALAAGGCQDARARRADELAAVRQRDATKPTVAGPHRELLVQRPRDAIVTAVQQIFEETGVKLTTLSEPPQGTWLLGVSLADRPVLVEILPIVPGRFLLRVTVDGGDLLTRTLLEELARKLTSRTG
jgi:hypothetical protein